jgi:RNA polymerase sigma-70 factor (ECF subfamily)
MNTVATMRDALDRTAAEPAGQNLVELLTAEFDRFYRVVYQYLLHRLFDRELAEELTAQTLEKAVTYLHCRRSDGACLKAWLLRTATNLAHTHYRRTGRRRLLLERFARAPGAAGDSHARDERTERRERLRRALSILKPKDQAVVVLRYHAQMSFEEIAGVLECRPDAVRTRLSRAIQRMRRQLGVEVDAEE